MIECVLSTDNGNIDGEYVAFNMFSPGMDAGRRVLRTRVIFDGSQSRESSSRCVLLGDVRLAAGL